MIHYAECPVCKNTDIHFVFSAKDHTVSQKIFPLWECNSCTARFTQDVPGPKGIHSYYASANYVSHSDTKDGLINKLYHLVRRRTLASKLKLITTLTASKRGKILDVGCGTGAFLHTMQNAGWEVAGLEPDENARAKANTLYGLDVMASNSIFDLEPNNYDAITLWHVLEHVHQLHEYIPALKKLLRPGGKIFIAVPNYTSYDAQWYKQDWAAYDVPRHLYHFSPLAMKKLMNSYGLVISMIRPMRYDAFYVSMLSEQYKRGRGNIFAAFYLGLISNLRSAQKVDKCSSVIYVIAFK